MTYECMKCDAAVPVYRKGKRPEICEMCGSRQIRSIPETPPLNDYAKRHTLESGQSEV